MKPLTGRKRPHLPSGRRRPRILVSVTAAMIGLGGLAAAAGEVAQAPAGTSERDGVAPEYRFPLKGLPDLVLPEMDAAKGRRYFATRACVVCHSVNGVGGTRASALDLEGRPEVIDLLTFITNMWRGGRPMLNLQHRLFGEPVDLTAEELADLIAFLHSPSEQKRFSADDIPKQVREFMEKEKK